MQWVKEVKVVPRLRFDIKTANEFILSINHVCGKFEGVTTWILR